MKKAILLFVCAFHLASCTKEDFSDVPKEKTRYVRSQDGEHTFNVKSDTLVIGDTIRYDFDGVAYQLFSGDNVSIVNKIMYQ